MTVGRARAAGTRAALGLALASVLACASAPEPPHDPYAAPTLPLQEGASVSGEVYPGHPHVFPLPLEEGTYFEIGLDRSRYQLDAYLFEPGVAVGGDSGSAYAFGEASPDKPGQVVWEVVKTTGLHHLRLATTGNAGVRYHLKIDTLRDATARDLSRHRALEVYGEAARLRNSDETEEALNMFLEARELFRQGEHARGIAATYTERGKIFRSRRQWELSRQEFRSARKYWALGGDAVSLAGTLLDTADMERASTHWRDAERYINEALSLARQVGAKKVEANGLNQRCLLFVQIGRYEAGFGACEEAAAAQAKLEQHRFVIDDWISLSKLYRVQGDFDASRKYLDRAQNSLSDHPDLRQEATVRNDLAILLDLQGDYLAALAAFQKALDSYEILDETSNVGTVLANMGTLYQRLGDWDATLEYYHQALARIDANDEPVRRIHILHNQGWVYIQLDKLGEARAALDEALDLAKDLDSQPLLAESFERIGELQLASGSPRQAEGSLDEALRLYRSCGSRWREPSVLMLQARVRATLGSADDALDLLNEAGSLYEEFGRRTGVADTYYQRARIEWDRGDLASARLALEQALAEAESLRPRVGSDKLRMLLSATIRPYFDLYIEILMEQHRRSPDAKHDYEALRESERERARSLLEILPEADLDLASEVPEELLAERTTIRNRINATELQRQELLKSPSPDEGDLFRIKYDLEAGLTELQEIERKIRLASPRYAALTRPEPVSVGEIQRSLLDPDTSLLEYSLGEARSYLWVVTDRSVRTYELPGRAEIETDARCLHWLITAFGSPPDPSTLDDTSRTCLGEEATRYETEGNDFRSRVTRRTAIRTVFGHRAHDLSTLLLRPAAEDGLLRFRLAVVSDGALEYVPFAALPAPDGTAEPLVAGHEVVRLPSASILAFQRNHPSAPSRPDRELAIVADPVYSPSDARVADVVRDPGETTRGSDQTSATTPMPSFSRLDFSDREAHAISELAPAGETLLLENFDANRKAVLRGALSGARYVHFATHGVIDTRYPQLSSLVLSLVDRNGKPEASGYLRLHDIYGLDLDDADMVVLSACDTALGREVRGEGLVGLTRGFLYAGAERVVASLWQVQDRATADLMERFYRGLLKEDRAPADALRQAQLETLRSSDGAYSFPYYWAGFVLQGEWR